MFILQVGTLTKSVNLALNSLKEWMSSKKVNFLPFLLNILLLNSWVKSSSSIFLFMIFKTNIIFDQTLN